MDKESLINIIKSPYILKNIFNYIKDIDYKDKLFLHSKKFQDKLDIKLIGLKDKYLKKIGFNLNKYLKEDNFKKDLLTQKYVNFLKDKNLNKDKIESIIYDIFENKKIKDIDEEDINKIKYYEILISIYSPLFKILCKTKNFETKFTIYICQEDIDKYKLKDDYINFFNDLNNLKIKYTSIFYDLDDIRKLNYLNEIKIDFKRIKRMTIKINRQNIKFRNRDNEIKTFFETLFSFNNITNNLIYLNICFIRKDNVNHDLLENK